MASKTIMCRNGITFNSSTARLLDQNIDETQKSCDVNHVTCCNIIIMLLQ